MSGRRRDERTRAPRELDGAVGVAHHEPRLHRAGAHHEPFTGLGSDGGIDLARWELHGECAFHPHREDLAVDAKAVRAELPARVTRQGHAGVVREGTNERCAGRVHAHAPSPVSRRGR